jgi:hypothetical protein
VDSIDLKALHAEQLNSLKASLLDLHKALIESERIEYEKSFGKLNSQKRFLELLINDPWFAWLKPLSSIVIIIDELLESEVIEANEVQAVQKTTRELLVASEEGHGFASNYHEALQRTPDVILAHAAVMKVLKNR